MDTALRIARAVPDTPPDAAPRRISVVRAVLALAWAAAVVVAVGDEVPTTGTELSAVAAALLASYPVIDVIASLVGSRYADARALRINAAVSALAAVGIAAAAFGSDAGATLVAFGAWAAVSGAIQFAMAVRRRARGRQLPMIVSGGLSTVAGLSFVVASRGEAARLATLAGYMAMGALLYLLWARRLATRPRPSSTPDRPAG